MEWIATYTCTNKFLPPPTLSTEDFMTFTQWYNCLSDGAKKREALIALSHLLRGDPIDVRIQPFSKLEYVHSEDKDVRIISGPKDPKTKIIMGPVIKTVYKHFVAYWNGLKDLGPNGTFKRVWMYSRENDLSLLTQFSRVIREATKTLANPTHSKQLGWLVCVNGDDNLVLVSNSNYTMTTMVNDGKRWDATQTEGILAVENAILARQAANFDSIVIGNLNEIPEKNRDIDRLLISDIQDYGEYEYSCFDTFVNVLNREVGIDGTTEGGCITMVKADPQGGWKMEAVLTSQMVSGSQRTTLGNGVINGTRCIHYCEEKCQERPTSATWEHHWRSAGINPEVGVFDTVTDADFCSMRIMPVGDDVYAVPKFGKFLLRMGWSRTKPRPLSHARGLITCLWPLRDVPYIGPWIRRIGLLVNAPDLKGHFPRGYEYSSFHGKNDYVPPPTDQTWSWIGRTYGVDEEHHAQWLSQLNTVHALPCVLDSSLLQPLFDTDT
jgi:hypothetical protein